MDQNEYKKFTSLELLRMVEILKSIINDYADLMVCADTEKACEFFRTRANSALNDAIGFRQEWVRRMKDDKNKEHKDISPML